MGRADRPWVIDREQHVYGHSRNGVACTYVAADQPSGLLVHAGIHGTEADAVVVLSSALRLVPAGQLRADVVLAQNPDGLLLGTRSNAAGVELNRNFPVGWQPGPIGTGRAAPDASAPPLSYRPHRSLC